MKTAPVDQIRKLRRLAERTTYPGEAELARRKAAQLQEKHGIPDEALTATAPPASPPPPRWPAAAPPFDGGHPYGPFVWTATRNAGTTNEAQAQVVFGFGNISFRMY